MTNDEVQAHMQHLREETQAADAANRRNPQHSKTKSEKSDSGRPFSMPAWAELDANRDLERYLAKEKRLIMDGERQTREYLAKKDRVMMKR